MFSSISYNLEKKIRFPRILESVTNEQINTTCSKTLHFDDHLIMRIFTETKIVIQRILMKLNLSNVEWINVRPILGCIIDNYEWNMNKIDCNGVLTNRSKIGIHQSHTNKGIEILIIFSIDGSITKTPDIIKVVTINIIKMFFWKSILCFGNV